MVMNGNFETIGSNVQDVFGWFDYVSGNGDLQQLDTASAANPDDTDGSYWLNLVDNSTFTGGPRGVYQQIGTHDAGVTGYTVTLTLGQRTDFAFNEFHLHLYSGSAAGADGTAPGILGLTLVDSVLNIGGPSGGAGSTETVFFQLDAASLGVGTTLWLALESTADNPSSTSQQGLIDDISISAIPEPSACAFLAGGLGSFVVLRQRR